MRFRDDLADQPGVTSPLPYPEYGSDEMLVMEYVDGVHINDVEALRAKGTIRPSWESAWQRTT